MAKSKAPKPTQTLVEIPSGEDEDDPRLSGALRGLNPAKYVLPDTSAQCTIETLENDDVFMASDSRHATRASRGTGKAVSYDMKFHPMDVVTRPNSAAVRRRSASRSHAHSDEEDEYRSDEEEDGDDVSTQSSARSSDAESAESSQDGQRSNALPKRIVLGPRTPNPSASRHSSRRAAKKAVIYSTKHHPQDYGLPGFQHKAITIEDDENESPAEEPRKRKAVSSDIEHQDHSNIATAAKPQVPRRARKKLRSLNDSRPAHVKKKRAQPAKTTSKTNKKSIVHDIEDLVEKAIRGSQAPAPVVISSGEEESGDESDQEVVPDTTFADEAPDGAVYNESTDGPRHLLEACASNLPETDTSGDRDDVNDSSLDVTSGTLEGETGTPATTLSQTYEILDPRMRLPTYLGDRIALELGKHARVTATTVVRFLFDGPDAGVATNLVVDKPYLRYSLQPPASLSPHASEPDSEDDDQSELQPSIADSEDGDSEEEIDNGNETSDDPYEKHTPLESQFEEQMEVTEHSRPPDLLDGSDDLANSDPIHSFSAINDEPRAADTAASIAAPEPDPSGNSAYRS